MTRRHAIVIAVDGLRASALGAYGNTTYPTPALDALAARSLAVDWMWCSGPGVEDFYRAAWFGQGAGIAPAGADDDRERPLFELLERAGVAPSLTTDDGAIAALAEPLTLTEVRRIEVASDRPAESIADTGLAQVFAMAIDQVVAWASAEVDAGGSSPSQLLWLHARGFHAAWDAPSELRQQLLDDDELTAADFVQPPGAANVDDPDALLQYRTAYAAQAIVLDACVDALMNALGESGLDERTLVVLVGCRGFALGEHGVVGAEARSLYSEQLHVPCLVRQPNVGAPPPRTGRLAQLTDLYELVRDWFDANAEQPGDRSWLLDPQRAASAPPSFVCSAGVAGEQALRTPAWLLRRLPGAGAGGDAIELYAKPFDRWEANEVAGRRADIAERLLAILDAVAEGRPPAPLDADLIEPAD